MAFSNAPPTWVGNWNECGVFVVKYTNSYFILVQSWGIMIDDGNVSHFISSVECVLYKIPTNRTRASTGDMNIDIIKIFTNMCSLSIRMSFNSLRPCDAHKRQLSVSLLVQVMACRLSYAVQSYYQNHLPLTYFQLDSQEHNLVIFDQSRKFFVHEFAYENLVDKTATTLSWPWFDMFNICPIICISHCTAYQSA